METVGANNLPGIFHYFATITYGLCKTETTVAQKGHSYRDDK